MNSLPPLIWMRNPNGQQSKTLKNTAQFFRGSEKSFRWCSACPFRSAIGPRRCAAGWRRSRLGHGHGVLPALRRCTDLSDLLWPLWPKAQDLGQLAKLRRKEGLAASVCSLTLLKLRMAMGQWRFDHAQVPKPSSSVGGWRSADRDAPQKLVIPKSRTNRTYVYIIYTVRICIIYIYDTIIYIYTSYYIYIYICIYIHTYTHIYLYIYIQYTYKFAACHGAWEVPAKQWVEIRQIHGISGYECIHREKTWKHDPEHHWIQRRSLFFSIQYSPSNFSSDQTTSWLVIIRRG